MASRPVLLRARAKRHAGADPVRADHDTGLDVAERPAALLEHDPLHPTGVAAQQVAGLHSVDDVGAGGLGRVGEQRVEQGTARGVERVDSVSGLDGKLDLLIAVVKRRRPDGGGANPLEILPQPPTLELEHAAAHQRQRGVRVASVATLLDSQDIQALAS